MPEARRTLHLFEAAGIELEYMLVKCDDLCVLPAVDTIMALETSECRGDAERGSITWSNELVLHVIELKVTEPATSMAGLAELFHENVIRINELAAQLNGRLLPSASHPWMDPAKETVLWPHEYGSLYSTYDRIFGCKNHGWANLQSMHINLPFANDEEFAQLHAAIRIILPILPALAASSPFLDAHATGILDNRLEVYRLNSRKIPSCMGAVIPEAVFSQAGYAREILDPIYMDLNKIDSSGILADEFSNARGAIARFSRMAIEIRLLDVQECPRMDLAIAGLIIRTLKKIVAETWNPLDAQKLWKTQDLAEILLKVIIKAETAKISNIDYLKAFGISSEKPLIAIDLWRTIFEKVWPENDEPAARNDMQFILKHGTLASRILAACNNDFSRKKLFDVYSQLADSLKNNLPFGQRFS